MKRGIELFSGAGGMSVGIRNAAPDMVVEHYEWDERAVATSRAAGFQVTHGDVRDYLEQWRGVPVDYFHASPPCQTYSVAGKGAGRKQLDIVAGAIRDLDFTAVFDDPRTGLVLEPLRWINALRPRAVTLEQVPTALPVWEEYAAKMGEWGYHTWTGNLHSEQYGVPQTRKRAFLIASLDGPVGPPAPTHSKYHNRTPGRLDEGVLPWVSMADALGWGEGYVRSNYKNGSSTNDRGKRAFNEPAFTVTEKAGRNKRINNQSGTEFDLPWQFEQPATAVAARELVPFRGANANRFNGATKSRNDGVNVTPEEAAVLQGFPADHPWQGNKTSRYLQIGNAVPPPLGEAVVRAVLNNEEGNTLD